MDSHQEQLEPTLSVLDRGEAEKEPPAALQAAKRLCSSPMVGEVEEASVDPALCEGFSIGQVMLQNGLAGGSKGFGALDIFIK